MCHIEQRDSSATNFDRVEIAVMFKIKPQQRLEPMLQQ